MTARLWKKVIARILSHAFQLCKEYALNKQNMSVERIADRIGSSPDTLYKYLADARMPAHKIIAYETACNALFITQYLAHSHGCLLVKIPSGRAAEHVEINELQKFMNEVVGQLLDITANKGDAEEAQEQIMALMQDLAFHKSNIEKLKQPELFDHE
jgi:hypothetical protein